MLIAYTGCLLPILIILNLFFGRLFFTTAGWLGIEGALIFLFLLNSYISLRRLASTNRKQRKDVIDVEGKVVK